MTLSEVLKLLESFVHLHGSQRKAARKLEISPALLNETLSGKRAPSEKVLRALNLKSETVYSRK